MAGIKWSTPPSVMAAKTQRIGDQLVDRVLDVAQEHALDGEANMKASAPWQDDTGNARAQLYGEARREGNTVVMELGGRAEYQIWLELGHAGRYAVVMPELRRQVPSLHADVARVIGGKAL